MTTACLEESDLQGYLEEFGPTALRQRVEEHLVSCARCREAFDRVVATHQRVNAWLSELESPAESVTVNSVAAMSRVMARVAAADAVAVEHLERLLKPAEVEIPWYLSLYQSLREMVRPEKLPPLEVTSKPVAVKSIWGLYAGNRKWRYISVGLHVGAFSVLMFAFTNENVQQKIRQTVDLIDPKITPFVPEKPKVAQGGGGGGAREVAPVTKGQAPKPAPRQFTPPMIVQEQPKLPMTPTIIAPPDAVLPQNNLPTWGDPLAKLTNGSNGNGFGGGMGNGGGGGLGSGKGVGYGPGCCEGIGGGIYKVGGGVSAPIPVIKVDPEYSEEARKAKYSGTVMLAVVVDAEGHVRDVHVARSLGMGLDEKAIEAVGKWKFKPGMKDGKAVNVRATIEVNFRLL